MSMFKLFLLFTFFFFFNDPATTEIYTLSLHDALPIYFPEVKLDRKMIDIAATIMERQAGKFEPAEFRDRYQDRSEEHTSELQSRRDLVCRLLLEKKKKK